MKISIGEIENANDFGVEEQKYRIDWMKNWNEKEVRGKRRTNHGCSTQVPNSIQSLNSHVLF